MGVWKDFLDRVFNKDTKERVKPGDVCADEISGEIYVREMAFWTTVNFIANAIGKCEFKTYSNHSFEKGDEYYRWNIQPNLNQNASEFLHKLIVKLYRDGECLVVEQDTQLLVADNYNIKSYALYDNVFTGVTVGDFIFNRPFIQSEVLYFKLWETNMRVVTDLVYEGYSKLLSYTSEAYRQSRGLKVVYNYDTLPVAGSREADIFNDLINNKIKMWLGSNKAALPLGKGQSIAEMKEKTYSAETTRDIRAMIDDISDFTAKSYGVAPALLRGDVQGIKDALEQTLTFCLDPLAKMLSNEINRKIYGRARYLNGSYLSVDTRTIKHIDLLSVAPSVDKLISSGVFSVNGVLAIMGEPRIDEPWADEHHITKNYSPLNETAANSEGDEE